MLLPSVLSLFGMWKKKLYVVVDHCVLLEIEKATTLVVVVAIIEDEIQRRELLSPEMNIGKGEREIVERGGGGEKEIY